MRLCEFTLAVGGSPLLVNPLHLQCAGIATQEKHPGCSFIGVGNDYDAESGVVVVNEPLARIADEFRDAITGPTDWRGLPVYVPLQPAVAPKPEVGGRP